MNISQALESGVRQLRAGHLTEAEGIFRQVLEIDPRNASALNQLGLLAIQSRQFETAARWFQTALGWHPSQAAFHANLGEAYRHMKRTREAIESYQAALKIQPRVAQFHVNLAAVWIDAGNFLDAASSLRAALKLNPEDIQARAQLGRVLNHQRMFAEAEICFRRVVRAADANPEAHFDLGSALQAQGKLDEAASCYRRAGALKPELADVHNNLGTILKEQGNLDEAASCFRQALKVNPDLAEAHMNLGVVLARQEKLDEAAACYRRALRLKPDNADALYNLGTILDSQGDLAEAEICFRRAAQLRPDWELAYSNLGVVLAKQGNLDEAVACCGRALALKPDFAAAHSNLGGALTDKGQLDEALACYRRAMALKPDWSSPHSKLLYTLSFHPGFDAQEIYNESCRWNRQHAAPLAKFIQPHSNDRSADRRLRIGYVSSDFRTHCQAFFTVPLFSAHDHRKVEVFCYSGVVCPDHVTARLRSCADAWRNIAGLSDEQVAQSVRQDQIDILVDLTMHMAGCRLSVFARKPAPVQVSWIAYPGTTGLSAIDYRLTDPHLDPPGLDNGVCTEESIRLPDSFWCYDPLTSEPPVNKLPALEAGYITFGSLNNFCKVNAAVLQLWSRVLRAVDRSRLLLLAPVGTHRQRTLDLLDREGITPDRVAFVARQPRAKYLELYHAIDIGLDTVPYNGHTTSLDSFWMGVPVITAVGQTVVGRGGLCQLKNLGLPELIAETPEQFVKIAVALANDLPRLSDLRATLRDRMQTSPLMDAARFARNMEAAYRGMWRRWCVS